MKRNKIVFLLSSLLCACMAGGTAIWMTAADNKDTITFDEIAIKEKYSVNALFTCPEIAAYKNGEPIATNCMVVFPDGSANYATTVVLNQIGEYCIEYSTVIDGTLYTQKEDFVVSNSSIDSFTTKDATIVQGNPTIEQYQALSGVCVSSTATGVVTYSKVLNLSESTKDDVLIDMLATPKNPGKPTNADFTEFYITLTDIYDSENMISIKVRDALSDGYTSSYIQAKAPKQSYYSPSSPSGCGTSHSFSGYENSTASFKIYYDNAERCLYTTHALQGRLVINDFDNISYIDYPWGGFTTGEVILSISVGAMSSNSAEYLIKSIYGNTFSEEFPVDSFDPVIYVDEPNVLPYALVNTPYKIFDYDAYDNNGLKSKEVKVYYRYGKGNPIDCSIKDGYFIPTRAGEYTLVYTATDIANRLVKKVVTIEALQELPDFMLSFDSEESREVELGSFFVLNDYSVSGGAGEYESTILLRQTGREDIHLLDKEFYFEYPVGTYEIVYRVTDYVGTKIEKSIVLTAVENTNCLLDKEISIPTAFVSGLSYKLPLNEAHIFVNNQKSFVKPSIKAFLKGSEIAVAADGSFTPVASKDGGIVTIVYSYRHTNGNVKEITFERPMVIAKEGNKITQQKYFITNGFKAAETSNAINFTTAQSGATVEFIRAVQAESFSMNYQVDTKLYNVDYFDIILTDKYDFNNSITVRTYQKGSVGQVGGSFSTSIATATDGSYTKYTLYYDNTTFELSDSKDVTFAVVERNDAGLPFKGFAANEVFITIKAGNATGNFCVGISGIANQSVNRVARDAGNPQIFLNPNLGGEADFGSTVTVYKAKTYDVYSDIKSFTVTVRNMDSGEISKTIDGKELNGLSAMEDYAIALNQVGRYQVIYTATDSSGRTETVFKNINVFDKEPPMIKLNGTVPTDAKKGDAIVCPSVMVTDNISSSDEIMVYMVVIAPNGTSDYTTDYYFEAKQSGTYRVYYVAIDSNNLMSSLEFVVTVA